MELRGAEGYEKVTELGGVATLCSDLCTDVTTGLSGAADDLAKRHDTFGANTLPEKKSVSFLMLCWEAMQDLTLIILIISAAVSLALYFVTTYLLEHPGGDDSEESQEWIDSAAIFASVVVVVFVSAGNDYVKEKQFRGLQNKIAADHNFAVIRGGESIQIPVTDIVVGDIAQVGEKSHFFCLAFNI